MDDIKSVNIIKTPYDLDGREIVCYPNLILYAKIKVPRMFMKPRIVYSAITVDLVRGEAALSNMFPEYEPLNIDSSALIKSAISIEKSVAKTEKLLIKWARHKYKIYKVPEIEILKQEKVYKAFFYTEFKNQKLLVDSVKGVETSAM